MQENRAPCFGGLFVGILTIKFVERSLKDKPKVHQASEITECRVTVKT